MRNNVVRFELYEGEKNNVKGTGFLLKIRFNYNKALLFFITCYHLIDINYIENYDSLFLINYQEKEKK